MGRTQGVRNQREISSRCTVSTLVVQAAGTVPARIDASNIGTPEQQIGLMLGSLLIYLRAGVTAHAIADGWAKAAVLARPLGVAVVGKAAPVMHPSASTAAAIVRMAGVPGVLGAYLPARPGSPRPGHLRLQVGPVVWEVCDANAYQSILHAWRDVARLFPD